MDVMAPLAPAARIFSCAGHGLTEPSEAINDAHAVGGLAAERRERPGGDDAGQVGRHRHRPDVAAGGRGGPAGHRAGAESRRPPGGCGATPFADVKLPPTKTVRGRDAEPAHLAADVGGHEAAAGHEGSVGRVEGREVTAGHAVDGREVTADPEAAAVGGGPDDQALGVEPRRGGEGRDPVPGGEPVGEDVVGDDLPSTARGHPRRPGAGEGAGDVDGVPDDGLAPHDAVDLPGRQRVCGHGRRRRLDGGGLGDHRGGLGLGW